MGNLGRLNEEQKVEIEFCKTSQAALNQKVKNVLNQVKQMEDDLSESDKLRKLQEETLSRIRLECSNVEAKSIEKDKTIEEFKEGTSNLKNCMAQVEVLESTNQTLLQNVHDQDSKIKNL